MRKKDLFVQQQKLKAFLATNIFTVTTTRKRCVCVCVRVRMCTYAQLCLTLCHPSSPPGSSVHRILQERTLEWADISLSNTGTELMSPESPALACRLFTMSTTWEARKGYTRTYSCVLYMDFF